MILRKILLLFPNLFKINIKEKNIKYFIIKIYQLKYSYINNFLFISNLIYSHYFFLLIFITI